MPNRQRVLVLSPNAWDLDELAKPRYARDYEFVFLDAGFYKSHILQGGLTFDVLGSIARAIAAGRAARVDGVIGTHDYPASLQAAAVADGLGLPGPRVDAALLCHHKYLCREVQRRAVPDAVPAFGLIDPFDFSPSSLPLPFPFFVKPVKGTLSVRAALARDYPALQAILRFSPLEKLAALTVMRPFNQMLAAYSAFDTHGNAFIAEEVLHGDWQVTVEGFADEGRVEVLGIVDSHMYPGTTSFQRFEYPSRLPDVVQARMRAMAVAIVRATGFDRGCFNVELMYDSQRDVISVIEMNPRMCTQFSDLYEKVDGASGYDVQLALATGRHPRVQNREGACRVAASFVFRTFADRKVVALPDPSAVAEMQRRYPGTVIRWLCTKGEWLSQQPQDMTSYRYAIVNIGAGSLDELDAAFADAERLLRVRFAASRSFRPFVQSLYASPRQRPLAT